MGVNEYFLLYIAAPRFIERVIIHNGSLVFDIPLFKLKAIKVCSV